MDEETRYKNACAVQRENLEAVMNCLRAGLVYPTIGALGWLERVSVKVGPNRELAQECLTLCKAPLADVGDEVAWLEALYRLE